MNDLEYNLGVFQRVIQQEVATKDEGEKIQCGLFAASAIIYGLNNWNYYVQGPTIQVHIYDTNNYSVITATGTIQIEHSTLHIAPYNRKIIQNDTPRT